MRPLCVGRDPEWWTSESDMARFAIGLCRLCEGCPDNDPRPHGVIRQGVPYADNGSRLPLCPCGYPQDYAQAKAGSRCRRCALPRPDRWRSDVIRWAARGDNFTAMGRRIGFQRTTIRDALSRWAREDLNTAAEGGNQPERKCHER